jgi:hypothetical protein
VLSAVGIMIKVAAVAMDNEHDHVLGGRLILLPRHILR